MGGCIHPLDNTRKKVGVLSPVKKKIHLAKKVKKINKLLGLQRLWVKRI